MMKILVTGGAGYIGSHAVRLLLREGHEVIVVDDLSHGHAPAVEAAASGLGRRAELHRLSTRDREALVRLLRERQIEAVLHFAAFIEVGESVVDPGKYYGNNFSAALGLLDAMREAGVRKLVFSSTAAVYGNPASVPILEEQPAAPINPYGRSKWMVELALRDYAAAYGLGYAVLRYFNVAGADPEGLIGEAHEPESHLIPRILAAAEGELQAIPIFGTDYPTHDGTCVRDYIHVNDLAAAHLLALQAIEPGRGEVYNLGSESGFSVLEVIQACAKVVGREIPVERGPRRPGDPPILVASSAKIRAKLGWERRYPGLDTIVQHAWAWQRRRKAAYRLAT